MVVNFKFVFEQKLLCKEPLFFVRRKNNENKTGVFTTQY